MAKQIIVLDVTDQGGYVKVNVAFWFPVTGTAIPRTNAQSAWKGISAQELSDLTAGAFTEETNVFTFPHGTSKATVEANLVALFNARLAALSALAPINAFYGVFFDGAAWTG